MRRFIPVLAVQAIGTLGFSIALPILVYLVRDLGGAPWTYGLLGATYSAFQLIGAPLLGRWSDRVGRRRVLLVSQAGTLAAWLVFLVALSLDAKELARWFGASITVPLLLVFAARAFDGLTGGNVSVANAYVADLTSDDAATRRKAFGWMGAAASVGFALGPAVAGVLGATRFGYRAPVLAATLVSALATLLVLTLPEPERRCPESPPPQPAAPKILGQQQRRCDEEPPPVKQALQAPAGVRPLLLATFVLFLAFNLFYAIFPVRADASLEWSPSTLGAFFTLMSVALIVTEGPLLSAAARHARPRALFACGMALLAIGFVGFASSSTALVFGAALLFALGNGLSWPTFQARIADAAGPDAQGVVQGSAASASSLASILGLVLGGVLYASAGPALFFAAAGLFVLLALAAHALFDR